MVKRHNLATRAFGAEPGVPAVAALAAWIAEHKGTMADITTYRLDRSLAPQAEAGIMTPCAGGRFYADRILSSIDGLEERKATGELHLETPEIIEDAAGIVVRKKGSWCAMPAPHALGIRDDYYEDEAEWNDAICGVYRTLMRAMRDIGVAGHVLLCDTVENPELLGLVQQKVFFFQPAPDTESLARLLDRQHQVAVPKECLKMLFDLREEYTIQKVFIIDPDPLAIVYARRFVDPDQIVAGGYCRDPCGEKSGEYWKDLVAKAVYDH
jgi:hypothetical protein